MRISLEGGGEFHASLTKGREIPWCDTYYTCALWNKKTHMLCTQLGEWCVWVEATVLQLLGVCSPGLCSTRDDNKLIGISCLTVTRIKSRAAHARHQQYMSSSQPGKYTLATDHKPNTGAATPVTKERQKLVSVSSAYSCGSQPSRWRVPTLQLWKPTEKQAQEKTFGVF